jgi:hypothetical protein
MQTVCTVSLKEAVMNYALHMLRMLKLDGRV